MANKRAPERLDGDWIPITPNLLKDRDARLLVRRTVRSLTKLRYLETRMLSTGIRVEAVTRARSLKAQWAAHCVLVVNVLCDLHDQGWLLRVDRRGIAAVPPVMNALPLEKEKERIRAAHLLERDAQLRQQAARKFVREMERRRPHRGEWHSIFSLMRDGRQLAALSQKYAELPFHNRGTALRGLIDPYVQVVKPQFRCEFSGLLLSDIWRYFRHTWTTTYQSTPGRKMFFLVRDRAAPNHPVIGIGALGSAIVQLSARDEWIQWTAPQVIAAMRSEPTTAWARWLDRSLRMKINEILVSDFVQRGEITKREIRQPTPEAIERLSQLGKREREVHQLYPDEARYKYRSEDSVATDWSAQARTHLFRSKRAKTLAELLDARRRLHDTGFLRPVAADLKKALKSRHGVRAIQTVLRRIKATSAGIHMMDITVCGAVAPYNHLIGGKLVSLLMASPEVVDAYNLRYRNAISVIASSIAGKPIKRRPHLALLGTTSLYGVGASQYNRLRMAADVAGGKPGTTLEFKELGKTAGYGSYHFSAETMYSIQPVVRRLQRGRQVNSIFGEGVNPKLRKIRGALDTVGLPSDLLLQHGSPRIVYAVPVASNFRDVLLDRSRAPKYLLPNALAATEGMANYWRERWLARRIENSDVLERVASDSLTYPITHGARVVLPEPSDQRSSFSASVGEWTDEGALESEPERFPSN